MMRRMEISFFLQTPIALGWPYLHFDGILAHLEGRRVLGEDYYSLPSKTPLELGIELPLRLISRFPHDPLRFYAASVAWFDVEEGYIAILYKRLSEPEKASLTKRKVSIAKGPFKMFLMRLPYIPVRRAVFYAEGDAAAIENLLKHLPGLGKKVAIGFGAIRDFRIEAVDHSAVVYEKVALRPIPAELVRNPHAEDLIACAVRPPYWDKRGVKVCVAPGGRIDGLKMEVDI